MTLEELRQLRELLRKYYNGTGLAVECKELEAEVEAEILMRGSR